MKNTVKAVRGMNDIVPGQTDKWQFVEDTLKAILQQYDYNEIRFPIVESTNLFKRSIGEVTDIVEKEMYTFDDRNGDSLTLRPEGTAGCVRAGIEQGLLYNQQQRLWYIGPMYRHERPQRGRYREFYQFGVEAFGMPSADIDAELICMTARFWQALGISKDVHLQLNTLGLPQARKAYRDILVNYFSDNMSALDDDSLRRLESNPLRILDSKNPDMQQLIADAPVLMEHLDDESKLHFEQLCNLLDKAGIAYEVNPRLVRGIDYYTKTVFEWVTDKLGSQGTVCAGGRYDFLVEQLGGQSTPGCGFALGMERLIDLIDDETFVSTPLDVIVLAAGDAANEQAFVVAESLRNSMPGLSVHLNSGSVSFKKLMKRADKSGAEVALILGDDEVAAQSVTIKYLRSDKPQESVKQTELKQHLQQFFQA